MHTAVTELLGIKEPILQGGMAWVADHHLAAAVSEAGGLGVIGAGGASADWVREQIHRVRELTDQPFGVNVMLMNPEADDIARVIAQEQVPVVTTGAGSPEAYLQMWKEAGATVIPLVGSVAFARRMEKYGADAVIAEGCESGGHIGELTTMVLVPQVADAVSIPVIAAGGIADGRGMAAAFMLGAAGVQMGTRFVVTDEADVHENYKEQILRAKDIDSKVTGRSTGHPVRVLRNEMVKEYNRREQAGATFEELEALTSGSLRKAVVDGDVKEGSLMAGQCAGMIHEQLSCKDLIENMVSEAETLLKGAGKLCLEGKTALVTGASRGIGRAIALKLAEEGAAVIVNFNHAEEMARSVQEEICSSGHQAGIWQCDVADPDACQEMVRGVIRDYGRLDILVNNAGITRDGLLMGLSEEDFDAVIDTNLKGTFHMMRPALRQMIRQKSGRIINISSVVGLAGNAGQANYAASKAGVIGLTKAAAKEVASRGITVNAVAPGFIETDMTDALSEEVKETIKGQIPLGRSGTPEQVAAAVAFLASDEAGYITGQVLQVDGGMVM